jgi:hypothetical protein
MARFPFRGWRASLVNPSPEHAQRFGGGSGADKSKLRRKDGKRGGCGADRAAADVEGLISGLHHRPVGIAPTSFETRHWRVALPAAIETEPAPFVKNYIDWRLTGWFGSYAPPSA